MAGIGFRLARMANDGGVGGVAAAASQGAVISAGPWLVAAGAVMALEAWGTRQVGAAATGTLQTILIYAFSLSALVAAPTIAVATRCLSDLLYAGRRAEVPGVLAAALAAATAVAMLAGTLTYGMIGLVATDQLAAIAIMALLAQIWVANLFLTATRRHGAVLAGYAGGIISVALAAWLLGASSSHGLLWLTVLGLAVTIVLLVAAIRREFPAPPTWPDGWGESYRRHGHLAVGATLATAAIWIDKWLIWFLAGDSAAGVGFLRFHPVYDPASFLGLLSLVPGLTLLLITSEVRFDKHFAVLMQACTGSATIATIAAVRRGVIATVLRDLRLLVVVQATVAAALWVLAPELFRWLHADPTGIFAFRFTVVGAVFHIAAVFFTIILSYLDLGGRVLILWAMFAVVSAGVTVSTVDGGFVWYGWGYLSGAVMAAATGLMLTGAALWDVLYLLFVGNNPAIMGHRRRWA